MSPNDNNGWSEWSRHVLAELVRLNMCFEKLDDRLDDLHTQMTVLRTKAGLVGALAGLGGGGAIAAALKFFGSP